MTLEMVYFPMWLYWWCTWII